jgi:hemoglobin
MDEERVSIYEFAGGRDAFLALAEALHQRCLDDPVLHHPFSHALSPTHLDHLADYLAEVFGGPPAYSELGGHSAMLEVHASTGADAEMAERFLHCFDAAIADARLPEDPAFRAVLHDYMVWATREVDDYGPIGSVVPAGLAFPRWSWGGPVS